MIEKMKFVSITGPREDIDRVVNNYLSRYEIHLENALTELTDVKNLSPYLEINPYKEALSTVGSFYEEVENPEQASAKKLPIEKALSFVQQIKDEADVLNKTRQELEEKRDSLAESLRIIYPFRNVDFDVQSILKMRYIHYRFGRIEKDYSINLKHTFMIIWIRFSLNVMKMTVISGEFILFPFMKHSEFMPYILLCTLKKSLYRISMMELPKLHTQHLKRSTRKQLQILMQTKRQEKLSLEKMHPTLFPANIHFPSFHGTLISVNWQHAHMGTIRERQQPIISRKNHFISFVAG